MQNDVDVVVIGAGFSGLYAVHKFRDDLGLTVRAFDAASGPGGTWTWNRYPGARCDFESVHYSYSFSADIQEQWRWTERFASQPEILAYLEWVADRLDLRKEYSFSTSVVAMTWDEAESRWAVETSDGQRTRARYVVSGAGGLSKPATPDFPGSGSFTGELYSTSRWPHEEVDLTGKRVAVVGTGSSGIQIIQEAAKSAAHLTVFQRTANYAVPLGNRPLSQEEQAWNSAHHAQIRAARSPLSGADYPPPTTSALAVSAQERRATYDAMWERGAMSLMLSSFVDILVDRRANDTLADYIRDRIRSRVDDPATAELLCPDDHPYAAKRPPMETGYYEVFNQDNVDLVDVRTSPIRRITPTGLETDDAAFEVDVIILAVGFDAFTGAQLAVPTTGVGGLTLQEKWSAGPASFLGLATAGFPNLFSILGPPSPASQFNTPMLIEQHVDFVADAIRDAERRGSPTVEVLEAAEDLWGRLVNGLLELSLLPQAARTWYLGDNIPGKPRVAYAFVGGAPLYSAICAQSQGLGFSGFAFGGQPAAEHLPPLLRLDPHAAGVIAFLLNSGAPPLSAVPLDVMRAQVEMQAAMQPPGPDMAVVDVDEPRVRVYTPPTGQPPRPVVVYLHGGGFVSGSVAASDAVCRALAQQLGAVVVNVEYRLAPEHPFPAALEDSIAALRWVADGIGAHGGDPGRVVLMGESAGAHLAAVTALHARDHGVELAAQVLLYPPMDPEADTPSMREFADGPFLTTEAGRRFWDLYLAGAPITSRVAPMRSARLDGLPPTLVVTMELDPIRDEGEAYALALADAGVTVEQLRVDGLMHAAFTMGGMIPRAAEIFEAVGAFLGQHLAQTPAAAADLALARG